MVEGVVGCTTGRGMEVDSKDAMEANLDVAAECA